MKFVTVLFLALMCSSTSAVLPNYSPAIQDTVRTREDLIQDYFNLGLTAPEITSFLVCVHGIQISVRHLKRLLKRLGCTRRRNRSDIREVVNAVERELRGSGGLLGYRAMHQRLVNHHRLVTTREVVRHTLRIFDPEGVQAR